MHVAYLGRIHCWKQACSCASSQRTGQHYLSVYLYFYHLRSFLFDRRFQPLLPLRSDQLFCRDQRAPKPIGPIPVERLSFVLGDARRRGLGGRPGGLANRPLANQPRASRQSPARTAPVSAARRPGRDRREPRATRRASREPSRPEARLGALVDRRDCRRIESRWSARSRRGSISRHFGSRALLNRDQKRRMGEPMSVRPTSLLIPP